ncbi:MAG: DUF3035 domain-containing protein [Sphingorhabdus sp.]
MTRKFILSATALTAMATLAGCGSTGVFDRERPDEFAVTRSAPLAIPSEYTLPAPQPKAPRPQEGDTKQQVLDAMFGTSKPNP